MPSLSRRPSSSQASSGRESRSSRKSKDSHTSQFTAPTSVSSSLGPSHLKASRSSSSSGSDTSASSRTKHHQESRHGDVDVGPGTSLYPRASIDTYASSTASERDLNAAVTDTSINHEDNNIPVLPMYTHDVIEPNARPSSPQEFARLFPSLNRLSIRHDEYTSDGNMNLRIDAVITGRRRTAIQLFHLRMYDLAKREFSLRRYCRDSGREICNSKRLYPQLPASKLSKKEKHEKAAKREGTGRPSLQRSMSSAIKSLGGGSTKQQAMHRTNSGHSFFSSKSTSTKSSKSSGSTKHRDAKDSYSSSGGDSDYTVAADSCEFLASSRFGSNIKQQKARPPTQSSLSSATTLELTYTDGAAARANATSLTGGVTAMHGRGRRTRILVWSPSTSYATAIPKPRSHTSYLNRDHRAKNTLTKWLVDGYRRASCGLRMNPYLMLQRTSPTLSWPLASWLLSTTASRSGGSQTRSTTSLCP